MSPGQRAAVAAAYRELAAATVELPLPATVGQLRAVLRDLPAAAELVDVLLGGTTPAGFVGLVDLVDLRMQFARPAREGVTR